MFHKSTPELLKVCSVLPALIIVPAIAETKKIDKAETLTVSEPAKYLNEEKLAVANYGNLIFEKEVLFENNVQSYRGHGGSSVVFKDKAEFVNNNAGDDTSRSGHGPALMLYADKDTQELRDTNGMSAVFLNGADFIGNEGLYTGAIDNQGTIKISGDVNFKNNKSKGSTSHGTALSGSGGAINNRDIATFSIDGTKLVFDGNTALGGGAIVNGGVMDLKSTDIVFNNNSSSKDYGGAIYNGGVLNILGANNTFDKNAEKGLRNDKQSGGGVIQNRGTAIKTAKTVIGTVDSVNIFTSNTAAINGGAIVNRNQAEITINGTTYFKDNMAGGTLNETGEFVSSGKVGNGGAIYNYGQLDKVTVSDETGASITKEGPESPTITFNGDVTFRGNKTTTGNGGALWNGTDGSTDATATAIFNGKTSFVGNTAAKGGAIYNSQGGTVKLTNVLFESNKSTGTGGAIWNKGNIVIDGGEFTGNSGGTANVLYSNGSLIINDVKVHNNKSNAYYGLWSADKSYLNIKDSSFSFNESQAGSAMALFGKTDITNVTFEQNIANVIDGYNVGGAMIIGSVSETRITDSRFDGNKAANLGGAIVGRAKNAGDNHAQKLDIVGTTFTKNSAGMGGAIYNTAYGSLNKDGAVYIAKTEFDGNTATENGGAIYNDSEYSGPFDTNKGHVENKAPNIYFENVQFANNTAGVAGGAIYNVGEITLNNVVFKNNHANGVANDIYNTGNITVNGTTVLTGGIIGDGTLDIVDGATLNIGTAKIDQGEIILNGTVLAALDSNTAYGHMYAESITGDGTLKLTNVYGPGTYKMFNVDNDIKIDAGFLYNVINNGAAGVVISDRSLESISADTGMPLGATAVTMAMAKSPNRSFLATYKSIANQIENDYDGLFAANIPYLNDQAARAHPYDKPVLHSVTTSLHNQIADLTVTRMAAGRAGGDIAAGYGAWIQGMRNKSKYSDNFDSSTGGIAFGLDTLLNRKYTIGIGYANNSSEVDAHNRDIDIEAHSLFAYAQYKPNKWFVNAMASYTRAEYDEETTMFGIPLASEYDVNSYGAQAMTGYNFATGITPEAGVRYLHMDQDSYSNGLLNISGADSDFATAVAGIRYAFDIQSNTTVRWSPEFRAAATYDFLSDDVYSTVSLPGVVNYRVRGDRLSRMGGEFGIGIAGYYNGLNVSLNYELALHEDYTSQSGILKLKYNF